MDRGADTGIKAVITKLPTYRKWAKIAESCNDLIGLNLMILKWDLEVSSRF